jgi:two-component system, cell cycle sensor histidine kinase and response regulator CckA
MDGVPRTLHPSAMGRASVSSPGVIPVSEPLRVLLVEDSDADALLLEVELRRQGFVPEIQRVETEASLRAALERPWDMVLADYSLPRFSAVRALAVVKESAPDLPLIVVSGSVGEEDLVAVMRAGASDYVLKDNLSRLAAAIRRELAEAEANRLRREAERVRREAEGRLELQLVQAQKMEAVGLLAGGVAHDFNNLVTAIRGYGELALRRMEPQSPLRHYVEEIVKAGDRAAGLTRQLLAFSRKQLLQPRVLDLRAVVDEVQGLLHRLIGEDIELVTIHAPALGPVRADPVQMEQVLMNLAINARDAMAQGGRLTIETADVDLEQPAVRQGVAVAAGRYVRITVRDTGHGMDAETQARAFEPFFTTKEVGKGTGLGLATVYGIVKQSGGFVWVDSEPGRGTTFEICLPRADAAAEAPAPLAAASPLPRGAGTLLVVEDEQGVRELLQELLESAGYKVLAADRPSVALRVAEAFSGPIHLLVSDVVMPEMTGPELARRLGERRPDTRVLFLSGYTSGVIADKGYLGGDEQFLQKPFTADALETKVREILEASAP